MRNLMTRLRALARRAARALWAMLPEPQLTCPACGADLETPDDAGPGGYCPTCKRIW